MRILSIIIIVAILVACCTLTSQSPVGNETSTPITLAPDFINSRQWNVVNTGLGIFPLNGLSHLTQDEPYFRSICSCSYKDMIYFYNNSRESPKLYSYNTIENTWQSLPNKNVPNLGQWIARLTYLTTSICCWDDILYITLLLGNKMVTKMYDLKLNEWLIPKEELAIDFFQTALETTNHTSILINNKIYKFIHSLNGFDYLLIFDIESKTWSQYQDINFCKFSNNSTIKYCYNGSYIAFLIINEDINIQIYDVVNNVWLNSNPMIKIGSEQDAKTKQLIISTINLLSLQVSISDDKIYCTGLDNKTNMPKLFLYNIKYYTFSTAFTQPNPVLELTMKRMNINIDKKYKDVGKLISFEDKIYYFFRTNNFYYALQFKDSRWQYIMKSDIFTNTLLYNEPYIYLTPQTVIMSTNSDYKLYIFSRLKDDLVGNYISM